MFSRRSFKNNPCFILAKDHISIPGKNSIYLLKVLSKVLDLLPE